MREIAALLLTLLPTACSRQAPSTSPPADASGLVALSVRVPAALAISHGIDTLSVAVDPASLGLTELTAHAGTVIGVEAHVSVFPRDQAREHRLLERHAVGPGADFDVGGSSWNTLQDGVPTPGMRYVVEMQLVLFETDVPETKTWDPHAGNFKTLWARTLRQAEE
jgi:hypothetical protein